MSLLGELERPFVVLGNHDVAVTRDPFSRAGGAPRPRAGGASARRHGSGRAPRRAGRSDVDPESYRLRAAAPHELIDPEDDVPVAPLPLFRASSDAVPSDSFDLILAGHLHAGQISIPVGRHRIGLAHPRARFMTGVC